ncbi:TetR family transcriptional regulator [Tamaricihabitans halophyticus]|uniref:TetR family transcriptional regulator n=1 Tax=Tamaricihabitans halophyticus TaxID=1262583 RepID=A0A4V2SUZ9_9PSEU|nr:TetR/AcrR family transcriptional regulator [Tamaricihabitans halophyticus]TCP56516.1 TetR family transcriptional regulator [Tamaricihabitans halophyticus]
MTTERHVVATEQRQSANRVPDDDLLDAARSCVLAVGVRRTTLAEVARTASVSRMTLYRRFPDVRSMLVALMTREFGTLLGDAMDHAKHASTNRERLVLATVESVRRLVTDPIMRTVLDVDAEMMIPYVVRRVGSTQRNAERFIRGLVDAGHADGSVREGDGATQARALLLLSQSYVFSLRIAVSTEEGITESGLLDELAHTLDSSLRPTEAG